MHSDSTQGPSHNVIDWYRGPKNGRSVDSTIDWDGSLACVLPRLCALDSSDSPLV